MNINEFTIVSASPAPDNGRDTLAARGNRQCPRASASESVTAYRKGEAGAASNRTGEANIPRFLDRRTVTDVVAVARRREGRGA